LVDVVQIAGLAGRVLQRDQGLPVFHPALIDGVYRRRGSHENLQRTRGVLRLLASLVSNLWHRRDANAQSRPLIQPRHVLWSLDPLAAASPGSGAEAYQSVAAADVGGDPSHPARRRYRGREWERRHR